MKCLSTHTATGAPCQRTVGRDGCPHHGNYHIQQRLRMANRPDGTPTQLVLHMPMSRDHINKLIMKGYMEEAGRQADLICGCHP